VKVKGVVPTFPSGSETSPMLTDGTPSSLRIVPMPRVSALR
jgi:hypothetical protein